MANTTLQLDPPSQRDKGETPVTDAVRALKARMGAASKSEVIRRAILYANTHYVSPRPQPPIDSITRIVVEDGKKTIANAKKRRRPRYRLVRPRVREMRNVGKEDKDE